MAPRDKSGQKKRRVVKSKQRDENGHRMIIRNFNRGPADAIENANALRQQRQQDRETLDVLAELYFQWLEQQIRQMLERPIGVPRFVNNNNIG